VDDSLTLAQSGNAAERRVVCARCGTSFGCGVDAAHCWCADESYRMPMPDSAAADCLCPTCLRNAANMSGLTA